MQGHLGTDVLQSTREEMGRAHPVFQRPEHMLDRAPPQGHGLGFAIEPTLHRFEHRLVLPSSDAPIAAGRALPPEWAARAA